MSPRLGQGSKLRLLSPQTSGPDRIFLRKHWWNPLEKPPIMHIIFLLVCLNVGNLPKVQGVCLYVVIVWSIQSSPSCTRCRAKIPYTPHSVNELFIGNWNREISVNCKFQKHNNLHHRKLQDGLWKGIIVWVCVGKVSLAGRQHRC